MFEELMNCTETLEKAKKEAQAKFRTLVEGGFKELFAAHPEIEAVRWAQYAPYFNDGDPCVFHVREPSVKFAGPEVSPDEEEFDDDGFVEGAWGLEDGDPKHAMFETVNDLFALLDDDLMEETFDTDVQVIVSLGEDGAVEFDEDEYQHD